MKNTLVWLDDIRNPKSLTWFTWIKNNCGEFNVVWVKSYEDFTRYISTQGVPAWVSFDHDLGDVNNDNGEKTGYDCAKWLCNFCMDNGIKFPGYSIQSDNGPGAENIDKYIKNYKKHCE